MALSAIALTVIILVLVILCLTFGPSWSMAFLILFGVIGHAVHEEKQEEQIRPVTSAPTPAPDTSPPAPATSPPDTDHVVDIPSNASAPTPLADPPALSVDSPTPAADASVDAPADTLALSVDTLTPAADTAADTLALSVDTLTPAVDDPASAADTLALSVDTLIPAVDDPASAADTLALSVDALDNARADASALAPAVDVARKKRGKPVSSSTPSSLSGIKYEVFLNFRGTDSTTITDHLFRSLVDVGISVFKEDKELHAGKEIGPWFKEAIEQSRISIAILSTDYASSKWCLMELVQMWECRKLNGQIIIPIFYNVSPSVVRHQAGDFGEAFSLHEKRVDSKTIKKWREVLGDIAKLPGYSGKLYEGYAAQLAEEVVTRVARILRDDGLAVTDKMVGIDLHVQEMMGKLGVAHSEGRKTEVHGEDVRVIGIYGLPGVGKTTLAKVIYNEVHTLFEAYSFLEGISTKGVRASQQLLIADLLNLEPAPLEYVDEGIKKIASLFRNKKVLIVLDNVDKDEQIKALAGQFTWFGSGSRIIVTMNDKNVLSAFDVGADGRRTVEEHEVGLMSDDHALQLFRYHAFQGVAPEEVSDSKYDSLSKDIVKAIGRFPKDIVHHASNLGRNMGIDSWTGTLKLLRGF